MKSVIICEGSTDYVLLQYFMQRVNEWSDYRNPQQMTGFKRVRELKKAEDSLIIGESGGSSRILQCMDNILEINNISAMGEEYHKIVIITDRDDLDTEEKFLQGIQDIFNARNIEYSNISEANEWIDIKQENGFGQEINIRILPLVIPFDTTGALETFLLEAIAEQDEYDKEIINKGGMFVDSIDPEQRYLKKRRYATKAKFDVYFSVRTPIDQFIERRNILKDVRWENYILIQHDFSKLSELYLFTMIPVITCAITATHPYKIAIICCFLITVMVYVNIDIIPVIPPPANKIKNGTL